MANYYFVGTFLPALSFNAPQEITFSELDLLFRDHLTPHDYEKVRLLRQFYDLLNLRALWRGGEIDSKGELSRAGLEDALVSREGLPSYVYDFLERYSQRNERLLHFPQLLAQLFREVDAWNDPFLRRYLQFERELRLVMTVYRAKKLGRDVQLELQYENLEEPLIEELISAGRDKDHLLPESYHEIERLFTQHAHEPLLLQRAIDEYRVEKIEELVDMADAFSVERLLAYFTQFLIIEKWFELDHPGGMQVVHELIQQSFPKGEALHL